MIRDIAHCEQLNEFDPLFYSTCHPFWMIKKKEIIFYKWGLLFFFVIQQY